MGVREKYGFDIRFTEGSSDAVRQYCQEHLKRHGYPLDIQPASEQWLAICRNNKVYGVLGFKILDPKTVEIPDFYIHQSRWGILAAYAGIEYAKDFAHLVGIELVTATPVWNTKMIEAYKKVFKVEGPTHYIFRYTPPEKK